MAATLLDADGRRTLVAGLHHVDVRLVAYVTGGGIAAITDLLTMPGASRTVLDVRIPYSGAALADLIEHDGELAPGVGAVSETTAAALATAAFRAAAHLAQMSDGEKGRLMGVSCTAALTTDRQRRGDDRAHIAICGDHSVTALTVAPDDLAGATTRQEQDRIVADHLLAAVARGCGVALPLAEER